ncbi:MAG TPA: hypothetical protein VHR97_14720 [Candidatus Baltobacteraceae bacterium]|jgi:transcriptional regulator with XRE-family HTH domain|nr:hypothetical protein [Candidatus Baltobacteraceae bacterium]
MANTFEQPSIIKFLRPYRADAIAEAVGRSRSVATRWQAGRGLPDVAALPALAAFLRVDLDELTRMVAEEANARKAEVA